MAEFEGCCQQLWLRGALDSEAEFRQVMLSVVDDCHRIARRSDFKIIRSLVRAMHWVEPHCREYPLALAYELGCRLNALIVADCCVKLCLFDAAYRLCAGVMELLEDSDERERAQGREPRGNSETRYSVLRIIADCKWLQPDEYRDKLLTPEQMLSRFNAIYTDIDAKLNTRPLAEPGRNERIRLHLAWTEFILAKMAARYLPEQLLGLTQQFNRRHGAALAVGVGHFRQSKPVADCMWYWDFELTKLWIAGELTVEDLEYCHQQRVQAARRESKWDLTSYLHGLELECRVMRRQCAKRLEVLSG